ncbi:MAG: T9SS type A sorting domain-containing protein [Bacteroidota bacterium]|nr:T9SS type A sorting domain-containing protein [Bacteroidota bacterium]
MKKLLHILILFSCIAKAQNNALVINGAYMVMNGGTFGSNIQLVVNQQAPGGIVRNSGHIVTESQYNYIRWKAGTNTGSYIFPTGYSTTAYLPLVLNKISNTSTDIKVSTWSTPANNLPFADSSAVAACNNMSSIYGGSATGSVLDRWWDIVASSSLTADVTFNYRGAENTTSNPTAILNAQSWMGNQWSLPLGSAVGVTSGIGGLTVFGASSFSPFVLVNSGGILPIELISFKGNCEGNNILLSWTTATETNNNFFTIEKSGDAINWETVGTISGAGSSTVYRNYSYLDDKMEWNSDVVYYRLKQTDFNGKFEYFPPIGIANCSEELKVLVYPNPVSDQLHIQFTEISESYTALLQSSEGKLIFSEKLSAAQINVLNVADIASGVYFLTLYNTATANKTVKKIIIQ